MAQNQIKTISCWTILRPHMERSSTSLGIVLGFHILSSVFCQHNAGSYSTSETFSSMISLYDDLSLPVQPGSNMATKVTYGSFKQLSVCTSSHLSEHSLSQGPVRFFHHITHLYRYRLKTRLWILLCNSRQQHCIVGIRKG